MEVNRNPRKRGRPSYSDRGIIELTKANQKIMYRLKKRLGHVAKRDPDAFAVYKAIESGVKFSTKEIFNKSMSNEDIKAALQKNLDQLQYIESLRTSTVTGQRNYEKYFPKFQEVEQQMYEEHGDTGRIIAQLDKKRFFEIYGKMVEGRDVENQLKYEIFVYIDRKMDEGWGIDAILKGVDEIANATDENGVPITNLEKYITISNKEANRSKRRRW